MYQTQRNYTNILFYSISLSFHRTAALLLQQQMYQQQQQQQQLMMQAARRPIRPIQHPPNPMMQQPMSPQQPIAPPQPNFASPLRPPIGAQHPQQHPQQHNGMPPQQPTTPQAPMPNGKAFRFNLHLFFKLD